MNRKILLCIVVRRIFAQETRRGTCITTESVPLSVILTAVVLCCTIYGQGDIPSRAGGDADSEEQLNAMNEVGCTMSRMPLHPGEYYNESTKKATPGKMDPLILRAWEAGISPYILFSYYTRYAVQAGTPLGGYDKWYEIGSAYAERFAPNSEWLKSQGLTDWGVRYYTALNEPLWFNNNWRPYGRDEYRAVLEGLADGVHSIDPSLKVNPHGFIGGPLRRLSAGANATIRGEALNLDPVDADSIILTLMVALVEQEEGDVSILGRVSLNSRWHTGERMEMDNSSPPAFSHYRAAFKAGNTTTITGIRITMLQRDMKNARDVTRICVDNLTLSTSSGAVLYREDLEDNAHDFVGHIVPIIAATDPAVPADASTGSRVGQVTAPFHPVHAIADLYNNGKLSGIDVHTYYHSDRLDNMNNYKDESAQAILDHVKESFGITADIRYGTTEFNTNSGTKQMQGKRFLTQFWHIMGVVGNNGTPVTDFVMPFSLFRVVDPANPGDGLAMTESFSPWKGEVRGAAYHQALTLSKGMDFVSCDPYKTGVYVLKGDGKTMWVFQNLSKWSDRSGTNFRIDTLPEGVQTLNVYGWDKLRKSVDVAGKRSVTITGLAVDETYMFVVDRELPTANGYQPISNGVSSNPASLALCRKPYLGSGRAGMLCPSACTMFLLNGRSLPREHAGVPALPGRGLYIVSPPGTETQLSMPWRP